MALKFSLREGANRIWSITSSINVWLVCNSDPKINDSRFFSVIRHHCSKTAMKVFHGDPEKCQVCQPQKRDIRWCLQLPKVISLEFITTGSLLLGYTDRLHKTQPGGLYGGFSFFLFSHKLLLCCLKLLDTGLESLLSFFNLLLFLSNLGIKSGII